MIKRREVRRMEFRREEILPGVFLTALRTDKFKTAVLSLSLLAQLDAETASMNALIPSVLRRGTVRCPDMDSLAAYMDGLYGLRAEPVVRCIGEIQAPALWRASRTGSCPGASACSSGRRAFGGAAAQPHHPRRAVPAGICRARARQAGRGASARQADNKDSYAVLRLVEEMCASTSPSRWARWALSPARRAWAVSRSPSTTGSSYPPRP